MRFTTTVTIFCFRNELRRCGGFSAQTVCYCQMIARILIYGSLHLVSLAQTAMMSGAGRYVWDSVVESRPALFAFRQKRPEYFLRRVERVFLSGIHDLGRD